ncbi:hypothetical protein NP199_24965, partial [Salmonella enterica]|nr:hypothetical protein [Salmonella enterica]
LAAGGGTSPAGGGTSSHHGLPEVAPLQPEVQPPAALPFKTTLGPAKEPTPTHPHFLLYSSKSPPFPFHSSKPSKYLPFRSKTSRILPSLEDFTKVLSKKLLNSVLFFIYFSSSSSL